MPILVRPVREQLEHDRVIRLLQAKWKKQYDVEANVGDERRTSLKVGQMTVFPDLVMSSQSSPKRLQSVAEVETGESVNHLEAMAQWAHMSKARAPFRLYVPVGAIDQARRLCGDHQVALFELWSYYVLGEQVRFTLIQRDRSLGHVGSAKGRGRDDVDYGLEPLETETLGPLELPPPPPPAPEPVVAVPQKPTATRTEPAAKVPAKSAAKPPVKQSASGPVSPAAPAKAKAGSKIAVSVPQRPASKPTPATKPAAAAARPSPGAKPSVRASSAKAAAKAPPARPAVRKQVQAPPVAARKSAAGSATKRAKDSRAPRPSAKLAPKAARAGRRS